MRDYETYYKSMGANVHEKIDFIVDELNTNDYTKVVDIGCADGQVTKALAVLFPKITFIGLDTNEQVIKSNIKNNILENVSYLVPNPVENKRLYDDNTLVIFSSVLHEMFTFMKDEQIIKLIYETTDARAVAIRDMRYSVTLEDKEPLRPVYYRDYDKEKIREFFLLKGAVPHGLQEMNSLFLASVYNNMHTLEFLLKYQYQANWQEELKENYFSTDWNLLDRLYTNIDFSQVYYKLYINQYLVNKLPDIKKLSNSTHCKVIYKRLR